MRISKSQLVKLIQEEQKRLTEDDISTELDHLRQNIDDDRDHIDNLEDDIRDDRDEMERAHREELDHERAKHEAREVTKNQLRRIVRRTLTEEHVETDSGIHLHVHHHGSDASEDEGSSDEHEQGYDAREDEHLAAEHGAESDHEQDYEDRRDDAGFEVRQESLQRKALKLRLARSIRKSLYKNR